MCVTALLAVQSKSAYQGLCVTTALSPAGPRDSAHLKYTAQPREQEPRPAEPLQAGILFLGCKTHHFWTPFQIHTGQGVVAPTTRRNRFESRRKMPGMTKRLSGSSGKPGAVRTVIRVGRSGRNLASSSLWGNVYSPGSHGLQTSFSNIESFKGWYVIHICTSPMFPAVGGSSLPFWRSVWSSEGPWGSILWP